MKYVKRTRVVFLSAVVLVVAALLVYAPSKQSEQANIAQAPVISEQQQPEIIVEISGEGTTEHSVPCESRESCNLTAFSALQKLAAQDTISMQYKTYDGLGVLVTDIAGLTNGQDGKFWVFEVNGRMVPVAADVHSLSAGDRLTWKFVIPE